LVEPQEGAINVAVMTGYGPDHWLPGCRSIELSCLNKRECNVPTIKTRDGAEIYYKD
jgi:hypothetical protein